MIVRELIAELLDYDMDATVEILVESKEDSFDTNDFEIEVNGTKFNSYLTLKVSSDEHLIIDKEEYVEMEMEIKQLEESVEQMTSFIEGLEQN